MDDTFSEKFGEFFNTFTLDDLYLFMETFDGVAVLTNWGVIVLTIIVIGLLFTPAKPWVVIILFYGSLLAVFFVLIIVLKNSTLTDKQSFIFFGGSILLIAVYCVHKYLIKS